MSRRVLVCVLIHKLSTKLENLKNIKAHKNDKFLIILDKISIQIDKKKFKNFKIIKGKKKTNSVPYHRNLAIKYAKKKFEYILFIDSDTIPNKNIIQNHFAAHKKYKSIPVIGGSVIPSFLKKFKNIWEFFDGVLSWFSSIEPKKDQIVHKPYHLPTCNLSIKTSFLKKYNIFFDEKLKTGEDVDLCNKFRSLNLNLMLIKNAMVIHDDRKTFLEFFKHQIEWGKHHYHLRYKKLLFNNNRLFLIIFFLFLYPIIIFFLNFLMTSVTLLPWIKKSSLYILCFFPILIVYFIKGLFTYFEFFKDLRNFFYLK